MTKRYNNLLLTAAILVSIVFLGVQPLAASKNYCHDEQANRDWKNLAHNSTEPEIKALYSLRNDLCKKVDNGDLELDTAIDIFETERQIKIEALKQRKLHIENEPSSSG
jgi:hypothetical protein